MRARIPYDASGFWALCRSKYNAVGLVIKCKNYARALFPNDIVVTAKYLKQKGIGTIGILLSRNKPKPQVIKQIVSVWNEENKLIIAIDDNDLINMIKLRETKGDPERIIDQRIFEYRRKIE